MPGLADTCRANVRAKCVPAEPLVAAIDARRGERTAEQVASDCGVTSKRIREWRAGLTEVRVEAADRVMCGLGLLWWEVFDEDRFPEAHVRAAELFG